MNLNYIVPILTWKRLHEITERNYDFKAIFFLPDENQFARSMDDLRWKISFKISFVPFSFKSTKRLASLNTFLGTRERKVFKKSQQHRAHHRKIQFFREGKIDQIELRVRIGRDAVDWLSLQSKIQSKLNNCIPAFRVDFLRRNPRILDLLILWLHRIYSCRIQRPFR